MKAMRYALILAIVLALNSGQATADEIRVAVASNFSGAIKEIAAVFGKSTGHRVLLVFGSTGRHYAQIKNGAPFDAFFAADAIRPQLLEKEGIIQPGTRFTYAVGKLVLWSPAPDLVDAEGRVLTAGDFRYLALANPKLAPYGRAAKQVMRAKDVWVALQNRKVRGENIGQTFQFVDSGNAELGFVAYSQIKRPGASVEGSYWIPPQSLYSPIEQQAVLLRNNTIAREFLNFVKSDQGREIIFGYGYDVP